MTDFFPQEVIRRKRDGATLSDDEIAFLVRGLTDGSLSEGQAAAFAMAVFFQDLTSQECVALTRAMTNSGSVLTWPDLDRPVVDKHSTGGVGDKVSLMLAPMLAACGAAVPMISGRGLGHTGGTLDKLDSIAGYDTAPDEATFRRTVQEAGCAIIGQTGDLAPADKRLYAIRDVTATVESIPLITASILSKKLAAGLDCLIMDVKVGNGAFMAELDAARALAESIVRVANGAGMKTRALITDMNQVLGRTAGNALEVRETLDYLTGAVRDPRLHEVTLALTAELLQLAGLAETDEDARRRLQDALDSGAAAERFERMVVALGGPAKLLATPDAHLPAAPVVKAVLPDAAGTVAAVETRAIGLVVMDLGGGRRRADDRIDYAVGLSDIAAVGETVGPDRPLAMVHARDEGAADAAARAVLAATRLGSDGAANSTLVHERIS